MQLVNHLTLQPKPGAPGCELNVNRDGEYLSYDHAHIWSDDDLRLDGRA